jgi:dTDP-4-dehydrorhamnose reductase
MVQNRRLWVTGARGFLGAHLLQALAPDGQSDGQPDGQKYRQKYGEIIGSTRQQLDLTAPVAVQAWLDQVKPDAVIHTAAMSKPNQCEADPEQSYAINVQASQWLARCCAQAQIPMVFTSSDMVFDGQSAPYAEDAVINPLNRYGKHKAEAEHRILAVYPEAVVCRMPLMFGAATAYGQSFLQGFLTPLLNGESMNLFVDEFRTPLAVEDAIAGLTLALANPGCGILHLGGAERISRYDFGLLLCEIWQFPPDLIRPCLQADLPMPAPRPADVSLNSDKARQLGFAPKPLRPSLVAIHANAPYDGGT